METGSNTSTRVRSIDVFRGLTMLLLIGEFSGLAEYLPREAIDGNLLSLMGRQFHHHHWNGLHFWDLIQPFFMFLVGVSLPFAVKNRLNKGDSPRQVSRHVLKRSATLLLMGWALYCIGPGKIVFHFENVLAQISFTYLVAYLIMNRSFTFQVVFSLGLLLLTEVLYRFFPVEGFNHPFVIHENFGVWLDMQYNGYDGSGWVSVNALPTAAHTIWGVLTGRLLMNGTPQKKKVAQLLIVGTALVVIGYSMNPLTPIIKHLATSSFVIVSGGWSILAMAVLYWMIDIKKMDGPWTLAFTVVSMNSLFIYLFAHVGGAGLIESIYHPFTFALFGWGGGLAAVVTSILVWASLWGLCYWMYKRRIFIKI